MKIKLLSLMLLTGFCLNVTAQSRLFSTVTATINQAKANGLISTNHTAWTATATDLKQEQYLLFGLANPGNLIGVRLEMEGVSASELKQALSVFITSDPVNPGKAVNYALSGTGRFDLKFQAKYGAYVKLIFAAGILHQQITIRDIMITYDKSSTVDQTLVKNRPWTNRSLSVSQRVELLISAMTPEQKIGLLREGWGIPGVPALGIPPVNKVEAIHGFSYGSGATIFPQSIALGATWDKQLVKKVANTIGEETVSAHTLQAWSPVLDVAQDPRWGRVEETYGEDPVLVSEIGGAWIDGFQSQGLLTTPKHFAAHGAPLGGRDSQDIGLSEREMREIHLVPFRSVIEKYHCQSIMENYSDYLGEPVAKNQELLNGILREEWGFNGFIVSDCGALRNLTDRKHYTAKTIVDAAKEALAAGVCTNCGDTYTDKEVIAAVKSGDIDINTLNNVCRTLLSTMFRNGFFDDKHSQPLDWNKIYQGWNSPEHKTVARQAAREAIVMLENKQNMLPLDKAIKKIAVIGPGADDLQPGDYTAKLQPHQLISVLSAIKKAMKDSSQVIYEKGCDFTVKNSFDIEKTKKAAEQADAVVLVLGDRSTSEAIKGLQKTSGEGNDYASLILPGEQEKLLEAVCETGKPVILILQSGRPYNLSYAAEHCKAILVNWLPGQEGGPATADVLFGDYNPAGRLPITFPRTAAQLPLYYNFKTSGRGYNYVDFPFYPLYSFGYGLSYTHFKYSDLQTSVNPGGTVDIHVKVTNDGSVKGDEVVQLYVTDMFATVKTRVMELKDFDRITLAPGETKTVSFTMSPYQLSLLDEQMDRVVQPGPFKIMVGGRSPEFVAADRIKSSVGYRNPNEGIGAEIDYKQSFKANFEVSYSGIKTNPISHQPEIIGTVVNTGNLTDVGKLNLYLDGKQTGQVHHFELAPGKQTNIAFAAANLKKSRSALLTTKYKSVFTLLKH